MVDDSPARTPSFQAVVPAPSTHRTEPAAHQRSVEWGLSPHGSISNADRGLLGLHWTSADANWQQIHLCVIEKRPCSKRWFYANIFKGRGLFYRSYLSLVIPVVLWDWIAAVHFRAYGVRPASVPLGAYGASILIPTVFTPVFTAHWCFVPTVTSNPFPHLDLSLARGPPLSLYLSFGAYGASILTHTAHTAWLYCG